MDQTHLSVTIATSAGDNVCQFFLSRRLVELTHRTTSCSSQEIHLIRHPVIQRVRVQAIIYIFRELFVVPFT